MEIHGYPHRLDLDAQKFSSLSHAEEAAEAVVEPAYLEFSKRTWLTGIAEASSV
jgi:hypothetical protein